MRIKNAKFVISVADYGQILQHEAPEIAIAGKSNVGKSSFINLMVNIKRLAKTSGEPGRTRLLNYFDINNGELMLVDLPGYGYAKAPRDEQAKWGGLIEGYLINSPNLVNVFLLVDIRHEPAANDRQMVAYLHHHQIPFTIIATKGDKLSKVQVTKQKSIIAKAFAMTSANIIVTSALYKTGTEEVLARIESLITPIEYDESEFDMDNFLH